MDEASEDPERRAGRYAAERGLRLGPRLGFGKDGTVFATVAAGGAEGGAEGGLVVPGQSTAVKALFREELFDRELAAYLRLEECGVAGTDRISGHNIPALIGHDRSLLVIEMSMVVRPFILDFAGAYLDGTAPEFDEETWAMTMAQWEERFGERWPQARAIMHAMARLGIDLLDPSPTNIGFVEG